jgi:acetyltransferase
MIDSTRLGRLLASYRNLMPKTDTKGLAELVANISMLAQDLGDLIAACDLNPVLVRKGSGDIRLVDALMLTQSGLQQPARTISTQSKFAANS